MATQPPLATISRDTILIDALVQFPEREDAVTFHFAAPPRVGDRFEVTHNADEPPPDVWQWRVSAVVWQAVHGPYPRRVRMVVFVEPWDAFEHGTIN